MDPIEIYTDGACKGNPGPGGWGAWLRVGPHEKELWGGEARTTNNRMELTAVIQALAALRQPSRVVVHTDSEYVKNGITTWIHAWKTRGWLTAAFTGGGFVVALGSAGFVGILGAILPLFAIVALTALEFLVAALQAYVFAILTCLYLNDALHPGH